MKKIIICAATLALASGLAGTTFGQTVTLAEDVDGQGSCGGHVYNLDNVDFGDAARIVRHFCSYCSAGSTLEVRTFDGSGADYDSHTISTSTYCN